MAVAIIRIGIALNESIWRNRHRARVRLSPVGDKPDRNLWLGRGVHHLVRNTNLTAIVESCPKSGCSGELAPINAMILSEFGSTGIEEMSVFQALSAGK